MAHLLACSIDVTKIKKERLYAGKKGLYLNLMVEIKDEPDKFGNYVATWQNQTEQERAEKAPRNYLGTGKIVWQGGSTQTQSNQDGGEEERDDLPF